MAQNFPHQLNPSNWCKFEAVDTASFVIVSSVLFAQFLLFCVFVRSLIIRLRYKIFISNDESSLFKLMALWFTIAFLKSIINIIVYVVYETDDSIANNKNQILISAICLFLDKMSSFSLHSILLKIPCIWIKNTIMKLQNQELTLSEMRRVDVVFKILAFMKVYMNARIIILIVNLSFAVYFVMDPNFGMYSKYLTFFTMMEACLAIFIYTFGIISLNRFKDLLDFPEKIQTRVIIEYLLLMVGCIARLGFNFLYFFHFSQKSYQPKPNCADSNDQFVVIGYTVMHFLPITTIILIYWPDIQSCSFRQSMLSVQHIEQLKKKIKLSTSSCLLGSGKAMGFGNSSSSRNVRIQKNSEIQDSSNSNLFNN